MKKKTKENRKTPTTVADVVPTPYNPRSITPEALETLGETMAAFGDLSGIVFNTRSGQLVGGNQRTKHLDPAWVIEKRYATDSTGTTALGAIHTPWGDFSYREVDWPLEKEKAANLAANQAGGEFVFPSVAKLLQEIEQQIPLSLTAFDSKEIDSIMKQLSDAADNGGEVIESKKEKPTHKIAAEARERHDYVLILCETDLDWNVLSQFLELESVRTAQVAARTMHSVGLNRVILASDFLKRVMPHTAE